VERDTRALKRLLSARSKSATTILLYHTPDLMPKITGLGLGIDLYLAGHTHGGQLRLPLYGALFTSSRWGKRYEMGRYEAQGTTLYVSRGLGLEGLGAPRARFLAPPELVQWTLHGP
jgi:predicted MPP superfamily phosphohydrolase